MGDGISNFDTENFFDNEHNEDIKKSFMGVYSIDNVTKYINFYEIVKHKNGKYPFAIFNTDEHNKPGTHWWSFLDIQPKRNLMLFDSFGLEGFKYFIVDDNEKIIDDLLYNYKNCKFDAASQKIKLCTMTFDTSI